MNGLIIRTENLRKVYSPEATPIDAVRDLSLAVQPDEIFSLVGPDGAGKTTTQK